MKPVLLVCDEMLESIAVQMEELEKYNAPTPANFLFCYALFEGMLRELTFQLYYAFPEKLKGLCDDSSNSKNRFEIEKDALLLTNDYYFILNTIIDKKLYNLSKNNLYDLLTFFFQHSGISCKIEKELLFKMTKARNIIAHSNGYKVKPWNIESAMFNSILETSMIKKYIAYINGLTVSIEVQLEKKYSKYTYERLLLESWEYTCPSKLSIYDVFDFGTGKANVMVDSAIKSISKLRAREKYLVSIWLENHNLDIMYDIMSKVGEVYPSAHIGKNDELRYLQQLFKEYPYLLDAQPFLVENGKIKI